MEATDSIKREFKVEADPATVFAFFTDPERLTRWMGTSAEVIPPLSTAAHYGLVEGTGSRTRRYYGSSHARSVDG